MFHKPKRILLAFTILNTACGTTDSPVTGTSGTGGSTSTSTQPQGGSGTGGASTAVPQDAGFDPDTTAGCSVWSASKLAPLVGIRFYGPDPGPCSITMASSSAPLTLTFTNDGSNRPTRAASADNATTWTYSYAGDMMTTEVDTVNGATSTIDYLYGSGTMSYAYNSASGTSNYVAGYTLDARGYPQLVTISGPGVTASWPSRYVYTYDACRIVARTAYNVDNTVNADSTQHYSYDTLGHLVRIFSTTGRIDYTFDYSCWSN